MDKIAFLSDCHLSAKRPHIVRQFAQCMRTFESSGVIAVYILGDMFDTWIGDDDPAYSLEPALEALKSLSKKIPVYFLRGNRDFLVAETTFKQRTGCSLLPDITVIQHGVRIVLLHGEQICTRDRGYQIYRSIARHPLTTYLISQLSLGIRLRIAKALAASSSRSKQRKTLKTMDVVQNEVEHLLQKNRASILIHGHTHRPGVHDFKIGERCFRRFVLGAWLTSGQYLVLNKGGDFSVQQV